jgi:hypothetical protein
MREKNTPAVAKILVKIDRSFRSFGGEIRRFVA